MYINLWLYTKHGSRLKQVKVKNKFAYILITKLAYVILMLWNLGELYEYNNMSSDVCAPLRRNLSLIKLTHKYKINPIFLLLY